MRKTKIICTLGPATDNEEILRQLIQEGMDVARLNFSHQDHAAHRLRVEMVKRLRAELGVPVPLLLDTKGPEIRLGFFEGGCAQLEAGQDFTLTTQEVLGNKKMACVSFKGLPNDIEKGTHILLSDGLIELVAENKTEREINCTVLNGGMISDQKGVNVPGRRISLPFISEKDRSDMLFGIENDFDFIAASFTREASDIFEIRSILESNGGGSIRIIAKIENADGVRNIDEILKASDGIMVARGDMGVEIPLEEIPRIQKQLIKKAYNAGKIVITATQMLESMISNPRPTRAETTDVANAIYDGTSAIMLSGETAAGRFPVEAVRTMSRISERTEADIDYKKRLSMRPSEDSVNVTNAISHATCTTAHDLGASAIITVTKSGRTARFISKFRPACMIIGCTTEEKVCRQLNLSWGVRPLLINEMKSTDKLLEYAAEKSAEAGLVVRGDLVVITAGVPVGVSGTTNLLKVHIVGNILVSGTGIVHKSVCGNLCVCKTEQEAPGRFSKGDILVIPHTSQKLMPLLEDAAGVITEHGGISSHAAIAGMRLGIPVIVGAQNATRILKSGTTVTMDGERGIVYFSENCQTLSKT